MRGETCLVGGVRGVCGPRLLNDIPCVCFWYDDTLSEVVVLGLHIAKLLVFKVAF